MNRKDEKDLLEVKEGLLAFYRSVEEKKNPSFIKAIKTFKNWQAEILNFIAECIRIQEIGTLQSKGFINKSIQKYRMSSWVRNVD